MKPPLTPAKVLLRVADADRKLDKLYRQVRHQMRRKEALKRLLGQVSTCELNFNA